MTGFCRRATAGTAAVALLLSGCAAPQGGGTAGGGGCDAARTALVGAGVGLAIGLLSGNAKSAAAGTIMGGAVGALACVAINAQSRQTKTAAVVEQDYAKQRGALPAQPQLVTYQTRVEPSGTIRANSDVRVRTNVEVVRGTAVPVREVKEELVLFDTDNKEFKRGSKVLSSGASGSYETDWEFKLPSGITQGQYRAQTLIYVNGQMVAKRDTTLQLVMLSDSTRLALADR